jgi:hypothetical protein
MFRMKILLTGMQFVQTLKKVISEMVSREAFQEQHPEDVVLELRGVHLTTKYVCGLPEEGLKLSQRKFIGHFLFLSS